MITKRIKNITDNTHNEGVKEMEDKKEIVFVVAFATLKLILDVLER